MDAFSGRRLAVFRAALPAMIAAVDRTPAESEPFPHFVVSGLFPDAIYGELLDRLPAPELFEPFAYEKHQSADGSSNRKRFQLTDGWAARLDEPGRAFWLGIRDALGCPEFKAAVFHKLADGLAIRFKLPPSQAAEAAGYPLPELFRETSGYRIAPHPDTRKKVVTMQIALPTDASQAALGTEFYRRSLNPLSLLREPRGFELAKRPPFLPNSCYAFSVLNTLGLKSWHGRTTIPAGTGVRTAILNIWYADAANANPDIVREHYTRRQAAA